MDELENLIKEIKKLDDIIEALTASKDELLDIMIAARKEMTSLNELKKQYPNSQTIPERINTLDRVLEQSRETLIELEKNLTIFKNKSRQTHDLYGNFEGSFATQGSGMGN